MGSASKVPLKDRSVLSLVYTPGVAAPCLEIAKNPLTSFDYTIHGNTIALLSDGSAAGGVNLEDISAPRCFEVEERLRNMLNIPVFHDDQHGTAVVTLAGIMNSLLLPRFRL